MEKKFDTNLGEVIIRSCMIDHGTTLEDGIEIKLDGSFIGDSTYYSLSDFDENNIHKIEEIVESFL